MEPFETWPSEAFWGIHHLVGLTSFMQGAITQALRDAAEALLKEIDEHKKSNGRTARKQYERDSQRAIEVLKNVQLFHLNSSDTEVQKPRVVPVAARIRRRGTVVCVWGLLR